MKRVGLIGATIFGAGLTLAAASHSTKLDVLPYAALGGFAISLLQLVLLHAAFGNGNVDRWAFVNGVVLGGGVGISVGAFLVMAGVPTGYIVLAATLAATIGSFLFFYAIERQHPKENPA